MRNPSKWTEIVIKFAVLVCAAVLMMHYWMLHELFEVISFYNFMFPSRSTQDELYFRIDIYFCIIWATGSKWILCVYMCAQGSANACRHGISYNCVIHMIGNAWLIQNDSAHHSSVVILNFGYCADGFFSTSVFDIHYSTSIPTFTCWSI